MIAAHRMPRRFSVILAVLGCLTMAWLPSEAVAGVAWHESYAAAQAASKSTQRPVLVIFTASWCEACQHLDSRLWANPEAAALVEACYEPVLVDVDADPALARRMGISHIPSACVTNANDQLLTTFDLPPTASSFVAQAARALQETMATAVAPPTTIAGRFPVEPQAVAQPQAAPQQIPQQPTVAPQASAFPSPAAAAASDGSRYAGSGSRYTERPVSSFAPPPSQPTPAATAVAAPEAPPWLGSTAAAAPAAAGTVEPHVGYQPQPQFRPQPAASVGFSPTPPPATAAQPGMLAGAGPASTATPYPTAPAAVDSAAVDSAATATDRSEGSDEKKSKNSLLSTLQKPFSFMLGSSAEEEAEEPSPTPAATPSPYPVGLDGFCPVTLAEQAKWVEGRAQWGVQHRGRTYLFAGANEQQRFLANPDRYAPALSGDDVVVAFEAGSQIPGQRRYGVTYQSRIYLFSSLETRSRFAANPQAYASRVRLAESPGAAGGSLVR